jgi:hypothetical protein
MTDHYLLDELETADMLEIDGLHAFDFQLDDALLGRAEAAAEAGEPFDSEDIVLTVHALDGRERRQWAFSYNSVMEAEYEATDDCWRIEGSVLRCHVAIMAQSEE